MVERKYIKILGGEFKMDRMIRFINNGLDRLLDRMLGSSSMRETRRLNTEKLIADFKVDLEKLESYGDTEGVEHCKKMIKLLKDNLERLYD